MSKLLIRCSSLFKIMGTPRKKSELLTETAKSYIESLVDQEEYKYNDFVETKEMQKGTLMEDACISLINDIRFKEYKKNEVRLYNDYLTGENDIISPEEELIKDTKCSWSKKTFPKTKSQAAKKVKKSGYDWQGHGYIMLANDNGIKINHYNVSYCLVDTPEFLCEWENHEIHIMSDIPLEQRLTEFYFERDVKKEELIKIKVEQAREYADFYRMQVKNRM